MNTDYDSQINFKLSSSSRYPWLKVWRAEFKGDVCCLAEFTDSPDSLRIADAINPELREFLEKKSKEIQSWGNCPGFPNNVDTKVLAEITSAVRDAKPEVNVKYWAQKVK